MTDIIQRIKTMQKQTAAERGAQLADIVRSHPNIDVCIGRIPTQEEMQAIERCPLYEGILILFENTEDTTWERDKTRYSE